MKIKQAVILCGGRGERLRPLTDSMPKPMIKVNGKPFLYYLLYQLSKKKIYNFVLLTGYKSKKIKLYFKDGKKFGWNIKYSDGPLSWNTGKRIYEAKNILNNTLNKDKLIELLDKNNISLENILKEEINIQPIEQVDWGYHCIKYQTFYYNVILNINNNRLNNSSNDNSQLFVKLNIISKYEIVKYNVNEFYNFLIKYQYKKLPYFPLCNLSNNPEYKKNYCSFKIISKWTWN